MRRRGARGVARRTTRRTVRRMRRRFRRRLLVGGMVVLAGSMVYKMSKQDADRVEQHTGQSVEELSDEELQMAMKQLGIQNQALTEQEMALAKQEAARLDEDDDEEEEVDEPAAAAAAAPAPAPAPAGGDYLDELERLAGLRDKGILTDAEFEAKKKQLLGL